jgi:hypothetical protein
MKRTMSMIITLASAAILLAIGQAPAAEKSQAVAKLGELPFPIGEMTCTGNMMAMNGQPGHATTATARIEKILGGNWVVIHYDEAQSDANPHPYSVVQYIGYEDAGKRFVSLVVDVVEGSGYATGVSAGWKGDAMTFDETTSDSKKVTNRDRFTASGGTFTHSGTFLGKDGKWVKSDEETCHPH